VVRFKLVAAVGAAVLLASAVACVPPPGPPSPTTSTTLPCSQSLVESTIQSLYTADVIAAAGSLWVVGRANPDLDAPAGGVSVFRLDPATLEVQASIPVEGGLRLAFDGTDIWVSGFLTSSLTRISTATNRVVSQLVLPPVADGEFFFNARVSHIAFGAGSVWVSQADSLLDDANRVLRIDPATNSISAVIRGDRPTQLDFVDGTLWSLQNNSRLVPIDPATNSSGTSVLFNGDVTSIVRIPGGFLVWYADYFSSGFVAEVSTSLNTVVRLVESNSYFDATASDGGTAWGVVFGDAPEGESTIGPLDLATLTVSTPLLDVPGFFFPRLVRDGQLWGIVLDLTAPGYGTGRLARFTTC
jgi:hypothetical protein